MKTVTREAQAINFFLQGYTQKEAMVKAGYSKAWAECRPNDIFGRPHVKAEIERRQNLAAKRADIKLDDMVAILYDIANNDITDLYKVYSDGSIEPDFSRLEKNPALKKLISSLEVETYTEGRGPGSKQVKRVKIRPQDRLRAVEMIIRHLGLSKEKVKVEGSLSLVDAINRGKERAGLGSEE